MPGLPRDNSHRAATPRRMLAADWLWLTVAILLSLALRIPFFRIPMLADEGGYAYASRGWLNGTGVLYDDLWISRPQGIFIVYAGILEVLGSGTIAFRFAAWISISLTIVAIWGIARISWSPTVANLAAILFAVMSSLPILEGYSANAEMFMGLPVALAMLWLLHIGRTGWSAWHLVGTGVLIGCAISLKPSAAVMVVVAIAVILRGGGQDASRRFRITRGGWFLAGVALVGIASLIHGWMLGWSDFLYATITYRLGAQSVLTVGVQHNLEAILRLAVRSSMLIALTLVLLALRHRDRLLALAGAAWSVVSSRAPPARFRPGAPQVRGPAGADARFLLHLWLAGSLLGAAIGGDWWSHYLIQAVAPLSIWMAATMAAIWPSSSRGIRVGLATASVVLLLSPFWVVVFGSPARMADNMFAHPGYPAQEEVAAWIREHSEPDTTIYVAFDQASIYYLADRPPAYRFLYDQELRGVPGSYSELIAIIHSDERPQFIISTRQPGPFADDSRAFWQEVGVYYEVVATIDGVPIYQDKTTIEGDG